MGKLETPQSVKETRNSAKSSEIPLEVRNFFPARKEEENEWCNFDINVSPSHFNLTSALEAEDKYKTKVEQKLRECYEKKNLPKLLNIITSRFFCVFKKQKEIQQKIILLAKS